jgi:CrcB protein
MPAIVYSFLLVALGGALGAVARLAVTLAMYRTVVILPLGTFISNILGCFIMGIVVQVLADPGRFTKSELLVDENRLFFAMGFCGSFTTLSSMIVEMNSLMQRDEFFSAFAYLFATFAAGFACFYAGAMLVRLMMQSHGA